MQEIQEQERDGGDRNNNSRPWVYFTVIICCYGFFKEFKPSEAFLTPYLVDSKNFTTLEVNSQIYPFWPYSYLVVAFFVFLFTDFLRYKPVILLEAFAYLCTRLLLIWGTSVFAMQWMQVAYGVASASEVAFFAYIYLAVPDVRFKVVTSVLRAVRLLGQSGSSAVAQIVTSTGAFTYLQLNYVSFGSVLIACVFALLIPNPVSFPCEPERARGVISIVPTPQSANRRKNLKSFIACAWRDFRKFYSDLFLLKWSIWWAFSMCGVLQVGNYVQSLWKAIGEDTGQSHEYNGLVEAVAQLCSAGAALGVSAVRMNWRLWGELVIGLLCFIDFVLLIVASHSEELWIAYLCHVLYRTTYSFLITIARWAVLIINSPMLLCTFLMPHRFIRARGGIIQWHVFFSSAAVFSLLMQWITTAMVSYLVSTLSCRW